MLGNPWDKCCVGPFGNGLMCEASAQCCDGLCVAKGEGCADPCREGLIQCGGVCVPGSLGDVCCESANGDPFVCPTPGVCCDGMCVANGTSCAAPCRPGLMNCGGQCLAGKPGDVCCLGPLGNGLMCGPTDECCDGVCVLQGFGCAEICAPGLVRCGGQCIAGFEEGTCCLNHAGTGIMCAPGAECCDGVCVALGTGCANPCDEGLVRCGGQCLPGNTNSLCCEGPTGAGILCPTDSQCCGGLCEAVGSPCALENLYE